jgi:hypothetical protein
MMASNRSMLLQESDGVKICIGSTVIPSPDSPANWCPLHLVKMWVLTAWQAWVYSGTRCGIWTLGRLAERDKHAGFAISSADKVLHIQLLETKQIEKCEAVT